MIQDITKIEDKKEYDKVLYKILADLDGRLSSFRQIVLDKSMAIPFILDKDSIIPNGYKQCDGKNGTYDLSGLEQDITASSTLIYIQRIA